MFSKVDSDILIGRTYEDSININDIGVAQNLKNGSSSNNNGNYLMLITADGYVIDRGTPQDQIDMGMSDDLLGTSLLSELITMDACANTTLALDIFNLLVNLKIVAGTVGVVSGLVVLATAATVSTIIAKVAAGTAAAPVPGARIAALVLLVVAGLIMLGAGIYTLWEAYQDKKRIEAIGGSKVNYCENYTATLKLILQDLSLSLPVYHYNIEKETDDIENDDLSLMYCTKGSYDYTKSKCVDDDGNPLNNKPFQVTLAYYANKDEVQKLNLEGAPMLIYYRNNEIVDYIYGAATPEFIIEMLRLWGT